jgi:hypothetical protein
MFDVFYSGTKPNLFAHEQCVDTIEQAQEKCTTRFFWWVNYLSDYTGFDFLWEPAPWEATQIHAWPSQHQLNGQTLLVPKAGSKDINRNHAIVPRKGTVPIIGIDHGEGITVNCDITTRYINNYLGTLRRVLTKVESEYAWVVSSVCDYTNFDFTWHPSEWQDQMLHVFASNEQQFGDTFYVHVPSFLTKSADIKLLEWYDTLCFHDECVPRKPVPVVVHNHDSQATAVWAHEFTTPVVLFTTQQLDITAPTMNLWREQVKTVMPLNHSANITLVPREAKTYIKTQLYDYPNIDKKYEEEYSDQLLDIVFIDNGEPNADDNFLYLKWAAERAHQPRIHRSSGVNGRVAAYRAAAELSTTPWFFAVFAKLEIDSRFDWTWQPDYLQEPKHYIFHAFNPVNGLEYGHQAMIAYNKKLVLENTAPGLDFTLDQAHEVVPILSGTANYHYSKWIAWRTAFREVIKLKHSLPDVENEYRLAAWLDKIKHEENHVENGEYSVYGAEDAVEYYDAVAGEFSELKKSYDWAWLASYAFIKRGLSPDQ